MKNLISILLLSFSIVLSLGREAQGALTKYKWTPAEKNLYFNREFISLGHVFTVSGKISMARQVLRQEELLGGCKSLHDGTGGLESLIKCIRFLDFEDELGLRSPGAAKLISDINLICPKLIHDGKTALRLLDSSIWRGHPARWKVCTGTLWEQVFLTAYASSDSQTVRTVALVRKALAHLPFNESWTKKTERLLWPKP